MTRPTMPDARKAANMLALETVLKLKDEKRAPTPSEQMAMAMYTGNHGLSIDVYPPDKDKYYKLLTQSGYRIQTQTPDAMPAQISDRISKLVKRLEPDTSATILTNSNWLGHLANPEFRGSFRSMVAASSVSDPLQKDICGHLYPGVFTNEALDGKDSYPPIFNLVVTTTTTGGRLPSRYPLATETAPRQMLSALEMAAPGGIVCMVCPDVLLMEDDSQNDFREGLQALGVLEGSFRVYDSATARHGTDIVFFRKYRANEAPTSSEWHREHASRYGSDLINAYYKNNPGHVQPMGQSADQADKWFDNMVSTLPQGHFKSLTGAHAAGNAELPLTRLEIGDGCLIEQDGRVVRRTPAGISRIRWQDPADEARARMLIPVRDAMVDLVNLHQDKGDRQALHNQRQKLHEAYDAFHAQFGPISDSKNFGSFVDGHRHLLLMTETNYNLVDNTADKSEVFTHNIFSHTTTARYAEDARHAFLLSMRDRNRVDLDYMSQLTRLGHDEILEDLEGQIFLDPKTHQYVPRWEYLSGDVSEKLVRAKLAQTDNPRMAENIRVLTDQIEKDFTDVEVGLGSPVVPLHQVKSFFATFVGVPEDRINLTYNETKERFQIEGKKELKASKKSSTDKQENVLMTAPLNISRGVKGVPHAMAHRLLICALHGRVPDIREPDYNDIDPNTNKPKMVRTAKTIEQTQEAITKIAQMKEDFIAWVKKDQRRVEEIKVNYRKMIGGYAKPIYSGDHLNVLPGSNPTISLRPYQKDGAARMIATDSAYLAYKVGFGKTFALAAGVMESRRLGLTRRPVIFTMDRLVDGFATQFKRLYPSARIYTARPADFHNVAGKNKVADHIPDVLTNVASGSYDVVILSANLIPHLPMSDWTEAYENKLQRERLTQAMFKAETKGDFKEIKEKIQELTYLTPNMESLGRTDTGDKVKTFDNIGVDMIVCDEFDQIGQAIPVSTSLSITGLPARDNSTAKKLLSIYDMMRVTGGKSVSASGTPLRNSIAEMWIVKRFHRPDLLVRQQALRFDRWFQTFADITTQMEVHVDSRTMRMKTRLGPFRNMRDMMLSVSQFADFVNNTNYSLEGIPDLKNGRPEVVTCESYPALEDYIDGLVLRAENAQRGRSAAFTLTTGKGTVVEVPKNDNLLAICTSGRKAALDMRMVHPDAQDFEGSKINECVRRAADIYHEMASESATQLVFCELGVDSDNMEKFSTYRELKRKFIAEGIPAREIRFAQEFSANPEHLERAMRSGAIRILIGNTASMGAGLNMQDRLYALHHLDVTYCARDLDQREGRILRPGNRFPEVRIFNYVQKGSFDAVMFEHNSFKRKVLIQITSFDLNMNRCDDIDGQTATLEEMKACACRDPILRKAMERRSELHHEIQKLTILDRDEMQYALGAKDNLAQLSYELENRQKTIENLRRSVEKLCTNLENGDFRIRLAPLPTSKMDIVPPTDQFIEFTTKKAASKHLHDLSRTHYHGLIGLFQDEPLKIQKPTWSQYEYVLGSVIQKVDVLNPLDAMLTKLAALPETLKAAEAENETRRTAREELERASQSSGKYKERLSDLRREMDEITAQLGAKNTDVIEVEAAIVEEASEAEDASASKKKGKRGSKTGLATAAVSFARGMDVEEIPETITDFAPIASTRVTPKLREEVSAALGVVGNLSSMQGLSPALTGSYALLAEYPELLAERRIVVDVGGGMGDLERISRELVDKRPAGWENPRFRSGTMIVNAVKNGVPLEICLVAGDKENRGHASPAGFGLPVMEPEVALAQMSQEAVKGNATAATVCNLLLHPESGECNIPPETQVRLERWVRQQDLSTETMARVASCMIEPQAEERESKPSLRVVDSFSHLASVGSLDANVK